MDINLDNFKNFGFNESFIIWVKTLYSNIQTCVMNNGWISEIFKNSRGTRQICPLSDLLFVLSVEIMAVRLRNNKDFKGFQIKIDEQTHSIQISQSADDTTLYFNSKNDISVAMNEIENFGSFSGLVINRNKTEGLWIGKLKHSKDKEENIKLNSFQDYCSIWKLKVNTDKSKVMVFSRGKLPRNLNFSLNGEKLEIVNSLNYLGI